MVSIFGNISLKRFCKMYDCMLKSPNSILSFLISISENDCRYILAKNVRHICDKWKISKADISVSVRMKLENMKV